MKNLGKAIDQLIKIDPDMEKKLGRIKKKWERSPSKTNDCWRELLDYLNSDLLSEHPKRNKMKDILNPKKKRKHEIHSFESVHPSDIVLSALPENLADIVRRHDKQNIQVAKLRVEAHLTRNAELMSQVLRKEMLLDINAKKLWVKIKDHFNLWDKSISHTIKSKEGLLVLVEPGASSTPLIVSPGVVKMDTNTFKSFLRFLGIDQNQIPPEQFPPELEF
jgi:hypothetical protein